MALEQLSIVLGAVLGFWTGFATRDGAWFSLALRFRIDFFPQLTMLRPCTIAASQLLPILAPSAPYTDLPCPRPANRDVVQEDYTTIAKATGCTETIR